MANFLEVDDSLLTKKLVISPEADVNREDEIVLQTPSSKKEQSQCAFVIPKPGMCIKSKNLDTGQKFFINLCTSDEMPQPDLDLTENELIAILTDQSDLDIESIKFPISIGEIRKEIDASGKSCSAVDIIMNEFFYNTKVLVSKVYSTFIIIICFESVEETFKIKLDKDNYIQLSNRKCIGEIVPQFVRKKPQITPITMRNRNSQKSLVEEVSDKEYKPIEYKIIQLSPTLAEAKFNLSALMNPKKLSVLLGADRIIVDCPIGTVDIFVPLDIHQEYCRAEYNCDTHILSLNMPLIEKP